jgi:4-amino-4-deoxy-L-arabinose transferase-like glycosyltransferase
MIKTISDRVILASIAIFSALFFLPFLGSASLFEGLELFFSESAREMVVTNNFIGVQINFRPLTGAAPFFIWLQAISMKVFGINEFAARFPNAICGIISLLAIFYIGKRLLNNTFGVIWVVFFCSSFLPMFYFRTATPTSWYTLFLFLSIYFIFEFFIAIQKKRKFRFLLLGAISIGLGALTKGIAVIFLLGLIVFIYLSIKMFKTKVKLVHVFWFIIVSLVFVGVWLLVQILMGNHASVTAFLKYQVEHIYNLIKGREGFFLFHIIVVFLGIFPASIFAINIFKRQLKDDREPLHEFKNWMIISFWTIIVLFTLVRNNLVQYSSLCFFSLTFLASYAVYKILYLEQPLSRWIKRFISTTAFFIGFALLLVYLLSRNTDYIISSGIIKDQFILGNLQANVEWTGIEFFAGLIYIIFILLFYTLQKVSIQFKIFGTLASTIVFNFIVLTTVVPHYEEYRQGAAIEFYKEKSNENCYVTSLGAVANACLFYSNKIYKDETPLRRHWLLNGKIDKPAYFVTRNTNVPNLINKFPQLKVINEKNGYVFLKREVLNDK